jgi:hypothetical protein
MLKLHVMELSRGCDGNIPDILEFRTSKSEWSASRIRHFRLTEEPTVPTATLDVRAHRNNAFRRPLIKPKSFFFLLMYVRFLDLVLLFSLAGHLIIVIASLLLHF